MHGAGMTGGTIAPTMNGQARETISFETHDRWHAQWMAGRAEWIFRMIYDWFIF
jgi:hypothetical protein